MAMDLTPALGKVIFGRDELIAHATAREIETGVVANLVLQNDYTLTGTVHQDESGDVWVVENGTDNQFLIYSEEFNNLTSQDFLLLRYHE